VPQLQHLMQVAGGRPGTFHRAFDYVENTEAALEILISNGVLWVLTSGCSGNREQGLNRLTNFMKSAAGRIDIVIGGGVRKHNIQKLQQATGATEFHFALDQNPTMASVKQWYGSAP